jgi:hypothetical protein
VILVGTITLSAAATLITLTLHSITTTCRSRSPARTHRPRPMRQPAPRARPVTCEYTFGSTGEPANHAHDRRLP